MKKINDVNFGMKIPAADYNNLNHEIENLITDSGQVLSNTDNSQLFKAVKNLSSPYDLFCECDVVAEAEHTHYLLTSSSPIPNYIHGMKVSFIPKKIPLMFTTIKLNNLAVVPCKITGFWGPLLSDSDVWDAYLENGVYAHYDQEHNCFILDVSNIKIETKDHNPVQVPINSFPQSPSICRAIDADTLTLNNEFTPSLDKLDYIFKVRQGVYSGTKINFTFSGNFTIPKGVNSVKKLQILSSDGQVIVDTLPLISLSQDKFPQDNPFFTGDQSITAGNCFWQISIAVNTKPQVMLAGTSPYYIAVINYMINY